MNKQELIKAIEKLPAHGYILSLSRDNVLNLIRQLKEPEPCYGVCCYQPTTSCAVSVINAAVSKEHL